MSVMDPTPDFKGKDKIFGRWLQPGETKEEAINSAYLWGLRTGRHVVEAKVLDEKRLRVVAHDGN